MKSGEERCIMELTHRLLKRQIKRHLGCSDTMPAEFENLVASVQETYQQFETDYSTLERALDLSSQELREANSGMKAVNERLVESSLNGIFAFDRECRYTVWNPAMKKFTNLSNLLTLGKGTFDIFPALPKEELGHLFYETIAGSTTNIIERPYTNAYTGEPGFMEMFFAPL